jgi:hypothetical protein
MLYAALALLVIAALLELAAIVGGIGLPAHVAHNASVAAVIVASAALLLFALGAAARKRSARGGGRG